MVFLVTVEETRVTERTFKIDAEDAEQAANNVYVEMGYDNGVVKFEVLGVRARPNQSNQP